jgi:hypothetical protein
MVETMTLPARFSVLNSNLNSFLFASIGVEESGMSLSVASVLARLGADPWIEAERLTGLSRAMAADALASMIAKMPMASWKPSDAPAIAARLVELLPKRAADPPKSGARAAASRPSVLRVLVFLLCVGLIAFTAFNMLAGR